MKFRKLKKSIKNFISNIKTIIVYASVITFIFLIINFSGLLYVSTSYGVSNGKPFCMPCLTVSTSLIKQYNVNDLLVYKRDEYRKTYSLHRVYSQDSKNIYFKNEVDASIEKIRKNKIFSKVLFEIPIQTTNDFIKACIYEYYFVEDYQQYDIQSVVDNCNEQYEDYCTKNRGDCDE